MKWILYGVLLVGCFSCASIDVTHDFDSEVNFSVFKTYNYINDLNTGLSALDEQRLLRALNKELNLKGLALSNSPDFVINIKGSSIPVFNNNTVGVGIGSTGGHVNGGISLGFPIGQSQLNKQLVFEFIEPHGRGLVWESVATFKISSNNNPDERAEKFEKIVDKVLLKFPPLNTN